MRLAAATFHVDPGRISWRRLPLAHTDSFAHFCLSRSGHLLFTSKLQKRSPNVKSSTPLHDTIPTTHALSYESRPSRRIRLRLRPRPRRLHDETKRILDLTVAATQVLERLHRFLSNHRLNPSRFRGQGSHQSPARYEPFPSIQAGESKSSNLFRWIHPKPTRSSYRPLTPVHYAPLLLFSRLPHCSSLTHPERHSQGPPPNPPPLHRAPPRSE